jgi:hypothetical protein
MNALRAIGRAHQVEGGAREWRALTREIGGRGLPPRGEQLFERYNGVLDRDQTADIGFGEVDRQGGHANKFRTQRPRHHVPGLSTSSIQSHM